MLFYFTIDNMKNISISYLAKIFNFFFESKNRNKLNLDNDL